MLLTIITFILVLSLLVFVHELGHFWVARKFDLKPREFGFGFPPRAIGYYKNKEGKWKTTRGSKEPEDADDTIYSINWLPLGGFVDLSEDEEAGEEENHFANKPIYQRALILLAGVTMNIILAAVLISFGFMVGLPQSLSDIAESAKVSDQKVQVVQVLADSPAEIAELEIADIIVAVDGEKIQNNEQLQKISNASVDKELVYTIKRAGREQSLTIVPTIIEETGEGGIGISIAETGIVRYPIHIAVWEGVKMTLLYTWVITLALIKIIFGLVSGQGLVMEVGGPIQIAKVTGDAARMGLLYVINLSAVLSINLAIINAFPFPALDGGRLVFLVVEKIKGSPVSKNVEATFHKVGFALLMILIVLVTWNDVARLI